MYQDSSGNQKNVIQVQRPDMENRHSQQRTYYNQNDTYRVTNVNSKYATRTSLKTGNTNKMHQWDKRPLYF